jgi:phosphorylase kinase alpha/beta subunit
MHIDKDLLEAHLNNIRSLQSKSGLFMASRSDVSTGYNKAWLRDNFYTCLTFEEIKDMTTTVKVWDAILDIFVKHKDKIDWAAKNKPFATYQYIHARYNPETFEEYWDEWGNKQNDAVGAILWKLGDLHNKGIDIVNTVEERLVVQSIIDYLHSIEYWHDPDNGVWEEYEEVHASSVGACLAGLKSISRTGMFRIPNELIANGESALSKLLPRESKSKFSDLALLSLIYPFNIVPEATAREIVRKIEYHLERSRGVIRYKNDRYYNRNEDGYSEEAEWCFGFPWLSIIYHKWANDKHTFMDVTDSEDMKIAKEYLIKSIDTIRDGQIPELYYSDTNKPNENTPLGWAESLFVVALMRVGNKFENEAIENQ